MKTIYFLCYAIVAVSLICGCNKESAEVKKDFSKLFNDGKIKADSLLKANAVLTEKISSLNPTKLASRSSTRQVKSAEMAGFTGQMYRTETYVNSNGSYYLQTIMYYYYDNLSRLIEKFTLTDTYLTGNFSFGGDWVYTYDINGLYSYFVDRACYYDQNWNVINTYEYQYVSSPLIQLNSILKFDNAHNLLAYDNCYYVYHGGLAETLLFSKDGISTGKTIYGYNGFNVTNIQIYDANGSVYFKKDLTYTNGQLTYATASGKYNGENFTYLFYNPDLVCYSNLKSDGSFSAVTIYRYDQSLDGEHFDPLNPVEGPSLTF